MQPRKMSGRCSNGFESDKGSRFHAVRIGKWQALCGAAPGRSSAYGWLPEPGERYTCPRCLERLRNLVRTERPIDPALAAWIR